MAILVRNFAELVAAHFTRVAPDILRCKDCGGPKFITLGHQSVLSHLRSKTHREKVAAALARAETEKQL